MRPAMMDDWKRRLLDAADKANKEGRSDTEISLAAGLGRQALFELRSTDKEPRTKRVLALAKELNVSLIYLFMGREDITPEDEELLALSHQASPEERADMLAIWRRLHPEPPSQE